MRWLVVAVALCGCRFGFDELAPSDAGANNDDAVDTMAPACTFRFGAGRQHLSALFPDGTMRVWGAGTAGQIGDGFSMHRTTPTVVPLPESVVSAGAGRYESCAALASGAVYCWGEGDSGQLGDGAGTSSLTPVQVANLTDAVEVAPAAVHACARKRDGTVWCWGEGANGRLGRGTTQTSLVPVQATVANAKRLIAGGSTSCVILDDDRPLCWGVNSAGGIGDGTMNDALVPTAPMGLSAVRAIAARDTTTCAVRDDGNVLCWGLNDFGQVGSPPGGNVLTPQPVQLQSGADLTMAVEVGLGIQHGCSVHSDGAVYCWGHNGYGQIANGQVENVTYGYARRVSSLPPIVHIGVAAWTNCALDEAAGVWCWGMGNEGQLADGTFLLAEPTPKLVFTVTECS